MSKKSINIEFVEYNSTEELSEGLKQLILKSEKILPNAYAPYSKFHVSSICRLSNGIEISGTNQENAAYPSGLCAERVAVFSAKSQYPSVDIEVVTITCKNNSENPFTPCGSCRQVLMEYENNQQKPIKILLKAGHSKIWEFNSVNDLLPLAFNSSDLKKR